MKGFLTLAVAALLLLTACENSVRHFTEKDTAGKDSDTTAAADSDSLLTGDDPAADNSTQNENTPADSDQSTPTDGTVQNDTVIPSDNTVQNDNQIQPDDTVVTDPCEGFSCFAHAHCVASNGKATCECDQGYHKNGPDTCLPDSTVTETGTFSASFNGPINAAGTSAQNLKKGTGTVEFSHLGENLTFTEKSFPVGSVGFPLAMITGQGTQMVQILWVEELAMSGTTKFFGLMIPPTALTVGSHNLISSKGAALFGDLSFAQSGMQIQCVRSVSSEGTYNVSTASETTLTLTSEGKLVDPKIAGSNIPYPVCSN